MVARVDGLVSRAAGVRRRRLARAAHAADRAAPAAREPRAPRRPTTSRASLDAAATEVERLSGLVDALLALARADAGTAPAETRRPRRGRARPRRRVAAGRRARACGSSSTRRCPSTRGPAPTGSPRCSTTSSRTRCGTRPTSTVVTVARPARRALGRASRRATRGPGLTDEQKARAFDRFWRAARGAGGSGLGLAIARRLVEVDGGTIELRDAAGGGLEARRPAAGRLTTAPDRTLDQRRSRSLYSVRCHARPPRPGSRSASPAWTRRDAGRARAARRGPRRSTPASRRCPGSGPRCAGGSRSSASAPSATCSPTGRAATSGRSTSGRSAISSARRRR